MKTKKMYGKRNFKLYNLCNGLIWELSEKTEEELDFVIAIFVKLKYQNNEKSSDEAFVTRCLDPVFSSY